MISKSSVAYTTIISAILSSVIYLEGGYTDNPNDSGGKTMYGITERVARDYGYKGEMKDLTLNQANEIYSNLYVQSPGFDLMIDYSPAITHKLIDAGVNVGTSRVAIWFQKALNRYSNNGKDYPKVKEDGIIGLNTINAYKVLATKRGSTCACSLVLKALDAYQATYYLSLDKQYKYTVGWLDKRIGNIPLSQCQEYTLTLPTKVIN